MAKSKKVAAGSSEYKLMCLKVKVIRSGTSRKSAVLKVRGLGEIAICAIWGLKVKEPKDDRSDFQLRINAGSV